MESHWLEIFRNKVDPLYEEKRDLKLSVTIKLCLILFHSFFFQWNLLMTCLEIYLIFRGEHSEIEGQELEVGT